MKKTKTAKTETKKETTEPTSKVDSLIADAAELCRELLVWAKRQNGLNTRPGFQPLAQTVAEKEVAKTETGLTEEESMKKMILVVTQYLTTHQKADVQKLLTDKFNVEKTKELTHTQRVELIGLLSEKNGAQPKEKVWA